MGARLQFQRLSPLSSRREAWWHSWHWSSSWEVHPHPQAGRQTGPGVACETSRPTPSDTFPPNKTMNIPSKPHFLILLNSFTSWWLEFKLSYSQRSRCFITAMITLGEMGNKIGSGKWEGSPASLLRLHRQYTVAGSGNGEETLQLLSCLSIKQGTFWFRYLWTAPKHYWFTKLDPLWSIGALSN